MPKLIIKKEHRRWATLPTKIAIDDQIAGVVKNDGEITIELSAGKHTIEALGMTNNTPKNQYELCINNQENNIIEVKISKKMVDLLQVAKAVTLSLFFIVVGLMLWDVIPELVGYGIGMFLIFILTVFLAYYSSNLHTIEVIRGVKLTLLDEDKRVVYKKYR